MLAKTTTKNQPTRPMSVTVAVGEAGYFDVEARNGQIELTPVRIQRSDAVRAKLAETRRDGRDVADAISWARPSTSPKVARDR